MLGQRLFEAYRRVNKLLFFCFFLKNAVFEEDENAVQNLGQQAKMKDSVLH